MVDKNTDVVMADDCGDMSEKTPRLDGVTCDFSLINRGWEKKTNKIRTKTLRAQAIISKAEVVKIAKQKPDASPAMQFDFAKAKAEADDDIATATETIESLDEEMESLLIVVLADLSRANLSPNAPESLDWADVASLSWITDFQGVVTEMMEQRSDMRMAKKS